VSDVIQLLDTDFFQTGLRFGVAALALALILSLIMRRSGRPTPVGGILIGVASLASLVALDEDVSVEMLAFGLILVGAFAARILRSRDWIAPLAVLPGAIWLAIGTTVTDYLWIRIIIVLLVPLGGFLINDFEKRYERMGLGVVFYALACLGVFVAVPDTEWARVLIAVAVPITFAAWPRVGISIGSEGAYLAVALLIIVTAHGGGERPASMVGSIASLGLLLIEPLAIYLSPSVVGLTTSMRQNWAGAVVASLPQFAVVALCSRVAARFTHELPAFIIVVIVYVATLAVGLWADPGRVRASRTT
jgi:hypothetical protein